MRIRSVEEVATGVDEVLAADLARRRQRLGLSLGEAARMMGAEIRELEALEEGALTALGDGERMRLVVRAYCECLHCDPSPFLARLEAYASGPVGSGGVAGAGLPFPALSARLRPVAAAVGLGLLFIAGLAVLVAAGGR
jgi:hypothetical protein